MTEVQTKERPILFSAPMVKAILAGRKTQTRRIVKNPPANASVYHGGSALTFCNYVGQAYPEHGMSFCPYGVPGDRLWVRETWRELGSGQRADGKIPRIKVPCVYKADDATEGPFRSSIHMPRWASRITLEVNAVRVQRVQEISEWDCVAEGADREVDHAVPAFIDLWDIINGKKPGCAWKDNPWVWVIEFSRVE